MNRPTTVEEVRALVDAAKIVAMRNFKRDWGTDDVAKVVEALRQTIPGSASPADAAVKARQEHHRSSRLLSSPRT